MITKENFIAETLEKYPETISVFQKYEMNCINCPMAGPETIEQAAQVHGIDLDSLIKELNQAISNK